MGCDIAGHASGGASAAYARAIEKQDAILATAIPLWTVLGYTIIVTSDHGHRSEGGHGGTGAEVVNTPLYLARSGAGQGDLGLTVTHTRIAPTVWVALGLADLPSDADDPLELHLG